MNFLIAATIITHITLLFTSFTFKSFPRPIHPHTYTSNHLDSHFHDLSKLLLCSSREPVYLSQHRDICLSVRPSVSRVMCLSEAGKFNRNKRWSLAGCSSLEQTSDSLVVPPKVKKRGSKANMVVCLIFYISYTTAALCYEPIRYLPARALTSPECREKTLTT